MSSTSETRQIVRDLLQGLSDLEVREDCIEALRHVHQRWPAETSLDLHGHLGRAVVPLLAARKNTTADVEKGLQEPFIDAQTEAWMSPINEFIYWFVRAGFAFPLTRGTPNVITLRLTARGRSFLETPHDHPLLPGAIERVVQRCPNLPDEVAALLADARECLDHSLMRPAVVLVGVAYEIVIEAIFDVLVGRNVIVPPQNARAAARINSVRGVVDTVLPATTPQERDDRQAARDACDFAHALRRRRNDASHTTPTYGFEDRGEVEELIVSAVRHLPNVWRLM